MKNELRKKYKTIRNNINNKKLLDNILFNKLINNYEFINSNLVLIYCSYNSEVDTYRIINYCFDNNKKVGVPKINGNDMSFYYINSLDELKLGKYNILEPFNDNLITNFENSICIVPGIIFDINLNRMGYGKGYYDKFLNNYNGYSIGLCYDKMLLNKIEVEEHDKKLNKIITDKREI